jgi:cellulose biosynthesis protein BcsQ
MFKIVVVDRSAESRQKIIQQIYDILSEGGREFHFIPRLSLKPLTLEELKFHSDPNICVVGEEIVEADITEITRIRKLIPKGTLLVKVPASWQNLASVEQLARMGVDDIITENISSKSFLQKLILLTQKVSKDHLGKLVLVTSGKGGAGVTSIAAGLAESILNQGKRVALVDFDFETQDLSRFLKARPFLNENLHELITGSYPVTDESVRECLLQVWADEPNLFLMPPPPQPNEVLEDTARAVRILVSVFEQLDTMGDVVVVDSGSASGTLLEMLYRVADRVVYVVPNDPASLYASVDRVQKFKMFLGESAFLTPFQNQIAPHGLVGGMILEEFNRAAGIEDSAAFRNCLPYSRSAARWPGSGSTILSQGGKASAECFSSLLQTLRIIEGVSFEPEESRGLFTKLVGRMQTRIQRRKEKTASAAPPVSNGADSNRQLVPLQQSFVPKLLPFKEEPEKTGYPMPAPRRLVSGVKII